MALRSGSSKERATILKLSRGLAIRLSAAWQSEPPELTCKRSL